MFTKEAINSFLQATLLAGNTAEVLRAAYRQSLSFTKKIGWHTFRRTLATLLTGSDENAKTTQELMRHANAAITMNLYAQALTRARRTAHLRTAHLKVVEMIRPPVGAASAPLCSHAKEGESVSS
jgi:integrase